MTEMTVARRQCDGAAVIGMTVTEMMHRHCDKAIFNSAKSAARSHFGQGWPTGNGPPPRTIGGAS
jgi:hypothetical protein